MEKTTLNLVNEMIQKEEEKLVYLNQRLQGSNEPFNEIQLNIEKRIATAVVDALKTVLNAEKMNRPARRPIRKEFKNIITQEVKYE